MKSREASSARIEQSRGFTLVELVIVLSIFLLLTVGSFSLFRNLQVSTNLNEQSAALIHALRAAQAQSLYGKGDNDHGIFFTAAPDGEEQIVSYEGPSHAARVPGSEVIYLFPSSIALSRQLSTSTPEIVFARNTGAPSATGTITLDLDGVGSRTISLNRLGTVEESE
ncbi:prepilin-type N-terminal cleavage/methylation domain-containing protein [Candidatus Uhrbacteria bacterium]|nr:prepilin-type N-terminal cleavage/methylation domain-containing protein [Candidatus Uhrbacteria bacterium]